MVQSTGGTLWADDVETWHRCANAAAVIRCCTDTPCRVLISLQLVTLSHHGSLSAIPPDCCVPSSPAPELGNAGKFRPQYKMDPVGGRGRYVPSVCQIGLRVVALNWQACRLSAPLLRSFRTASSSNSGQGPFRCPCWQVCTDGEGGIQFAGAGITAVADPFRLQTCRQIWHMLRTATHTIDCGSRSYREIS